jgi:8-oxo-dGTP pyrophosphatase MutT (NUDIX family)
MTAPIVTIEHLREALQLSNFDYGPAQERMAPRPRGILPQNEGVPPREAGVLALVYPEMDGQHIVLTRRTETLRGHSGQISFPGGRRDPDDPSFTATALRETCEELGICNDIEVVGMLSPFYIPPSHFNVYPTVGALDYKPDFNPNPAEVAEVFSFALGDLINDEYKFEEFRQFNDRRVRIPYYMVREHKVWGATAVMLSEIESRLRVVMDGR